ncbi:DUF1700 domain-containing protein [Anaerosacchariphilus polymeriproducens]|uniref:DUF1700 domain-containing protein n=1 Tax=Anaerosacchariphilus polymeriproducens TaxID=1812858 RepID=A0A371AYV2_9FIRM|nr:DUF1700 domain-containing protein [Anaerosacchariphilus polymeriproducens]RDU24775.1 DUF1700 domain-containing protein [Anaerosacchariphilus polymeriproducens]
MSKEEFLDELRIALQGEVSQNEISENLEYYDRYIASEIRKGRSIESVMEELGNPRLIARTIIDTHSNVKTSNSDTYYSQDKYTEDNSTGGFQAEYGNNGWDVRFGKFKLNTWYGKLLGVLFVIMCLVVLGLILNLLFPFILMGLAIWFLVVLLNKR